MYKTSNWVISHVQKVHYNNQTSQICNRTNTISLYKFTLYNQMVGTMCGLGRGTDVNKTLRVRRQNTVNVSQTKIIATQSSIVEIRLKVCYVHKRHTTVKQEAYIKKMSSTTASKFTKSFCMLETCMFSKWHLHSASMSNQAFPNILTLGNK